MRTKKLSRGPAGSCVRRLLLCDVDLRKWVPVVPEPTSLPPDLRNRLSQPRGAAGSRKDFTKAGAHSKGVLSAMFLVHAP
ncbi:hypothetical protein NDU88_004621 [Pleurodeles waltl]|uniref:Uncharacterized protein n=1 Tax=Pleurodeles waltl TaxID=8319 RepID=A0AAV7M9R8_PLEWA|nr:hypothetical protein NDU88_004621 [Pleurodeles waltl]